jgi:hypothetical protein
MATATANARQVFRDSNIYSSNALSIHLLHKRLSASFVALPIFNAERAASTSTSGFAAQRLSSRVPHDLIIEVPTPTRQQRCAAQE